MKTYDDMVRELESWSRIEGVLPSTLLELEEPLRGTLRRLLRGGPMPIEEVASILALSASETEDVIRRMEACGFVRTESHDAAGALVRIVHARPDRSAAQAVWDLLE